MSATRKVKPVQIVFLGASAVGKTSIIHQFLYGVFTERTSPTLGKSYFETIQLPNGKSKLFEIVDTSGSEEYPAMTEMYIHRGDHFVVVYSVDCQKSFAIAQNICNEIMTIKGKHFQSILLVGNKLDRVLSRTVSTDRAFKVAATDKKIWFLETSAFLKFNVHNIFCTILQMEMEKQLVRSFSDPDVAYQKRQKHVYRTISNTLCTSRVACKSAYLLTK